MGNALGCEVSRTAVGALVGSPLKEKSCRAAVWGIGFSIGGGLDRAAARRGLTCVPSELQLPGIGALLDVLDAECARCPLVQLGQERKWVVGRFKN